MGDPHLDRIRDQFTRQADAYLRMRQTTDEASLRALVKLSGAQKGQRALDVACGPGFLTMAFAEQGIETIGIDATPAFLDLARAEAARRALTAIEFRLGDAQNLPFDAATFDVASCRAAFHHFPSPQQVLAEMTRVLRPAGRLVLADMLASEDAEQAAYHNRIERLCDPTHVRALPRSEFHRLFAETGLEVLFETTVPLEYELNEWMDHGGPMPEAAREIATLMEASVDVDRSGLAVRRDGASLRFRHTGAAFLLGAAG
jgi:ubiquinone/menaquinone biosynthesis C-methylase UbiE